MTLNTLDFGMAFSVGALCAHLAWLNDAPLPFSEQFSVVLLLTWAALNVYQLIANELQRQERTNVLYDRGDRL